MQHSTPSTLSLCLFSPPKSHVIKLSAQNQQRTNKRKVALQQKHKAVSRSMTANIVLIVNFNDLNQSNRKMRLAWAANLWRTTQCLRD